jgi:hypothetical protein
MATSVSPRLRPVLSITVSLLILVVGWWAIDRRVRERPSILEDSILTPDEQALLPPQTLSVVLPQSIDSSPGNLGYRVLKLSLEKSGEPFALGYADAVTDQEASIQRIAASVGPSRANPGGLSVGMFGVGPEIDRRLRAVPIPVAGGLVGLRALWVRRDRAELFGSVEDLEDLDEEREIGGLGGLGRGDGAVAVQGIGWSDAAVLRRAGILTHTTEPNQILELLSQGRVDFYPRGVSELEDEARLIRRDHPRLVIERNLLLAYPFALVFYVHPENERLAAVIERGLRRAIADGSYRDLIDEAVFTPWLRSTLRLPERTVISIPNPEVEPRLAAMQADNWLVPWRAIAAGTITEGRQLCATASLRPLCTSP